MVRELSKHQSDFLFLIVCFVIARFASLSCYFSAKTRIRPVKSYQINESLSSITCCALLCIVYRLIAVSTRFRCPEFSSPNPNPHLNRIFDFSIVFSHRVSVGDITVLTLWTCKSVQIPFNVSEFYKLFNKFDQPYYSPTAAN